MPVSLTPESLVLCLITAVVGMLAGYAVAALRSGRRLARQSLELEQARQQLEAGSGQLAALQRDLRAAEERGQALEVEQGRLQTRLEGEQELRATLSVQLREHVSEISRLQSRLEAERQAHQAERDRLRDELASEGKRARSLESSEREVREQLQELKVQLAELQQRHADLSGEHARLRTQLDEREASHARELENFERQKAALTEQFKVLSSEILEAKAKTLQESSKLSLSALLTPFQQSIENFKREVQEIHHRETTQQGELRRELESLKELNQKITAEAHQLSTALRGQKKLQGNWGELVLENVLDRSGLRQGKDYEREVSFETEEGRLRPDVVVYLPQGKHLVIDAKVSLNAYTRFVNAEDENERSAALREHVQAVASRIRELADRDYYRLPGLNSPEMVFMFIPIESAFVEALKADETLFQEAISNNVLVATPTTLLTSLNIVRQLWRYEDQNKHTAALASRAESVFRKLNTFLQSFEKIKKGLDTAMAAYATAEGQLVSGKGNLVKQVAEFRNLAPAIRAELPAYFVEKAELEVDFIPAEESPASAGDGAAGEPAAQAEPELEQD